MKFPDCVQPTCHPVASALIPPTGILKYILQDQQFFCTVYQREGARQIDETEQKLVHTLDQAFESLNREGLPQSPTSCSQPALDAPNLEAEFNSHFSKQLKCVFAQEVV